MHESIGWADWSTRRMYARSGAAVVAIEFMKTFLDFLQRQQPRNFSVDAIMQQLEVDRAAGQWEAVPQRCKKKPEINGKCCT
jgi:hypothetical protein